MAWPMATSSQRLAAPPKAPARATPHLRGRLRSALATTPGRMRMASLGVLACIAVAWALGFAVVSQHQTGIHTVGVEVEPVVVTSQSIESLYSGADASAANSFLAGGIEPAAQRAQYLSDLQQAQAQLAQVGAAGGSTATATKAITTIGQAAATYAGEVETARANNRQGFPIGAAYLRQATALMHGTIIPAAETLHQQSLVRLTAGYQAASGVFANVVVIAGALILLVSLVVAQRFLRKRTKRVLNTGLVAATILSVLLIGWTLIALVGEASQVSGAQNRAQALNVLAQARVTAYRAKSDESFALLARGDGAAQYQDFDAAVAQLGTPASGKGFLGQASQEGGSTDEKNQVATAGQALQAYLTIHTKIQNLDSTGSSPQAISLALATGSGSSNDAFNQVDTALQQSQTITQGEFDGDITSAGHHLGGVAIGTSIGFLLVAFLVMYGFQQRIKEYQ
jgi:hypothetical protein